MSDSEGGESADETEDATDPRERALPTMRGKPNFEMNAIGWVIFALLLIVLIPLLPGIVLVIFLARLLGLTGQKQLSWPRPVS